MYVISEYLINTVDGNSVDTFNHKTTKDMTSDCFMYLYEERTEWITEPAVIINCHIYAIKISVHTVQPIIISEC